MFFCWPRWLFFVVVMLLGIMSMLSGCGRKGPLYIPQPEEVAAEAQNPSETAAEPDVEPPAETAQDEPSQSQN